MTVVTFFGATGACALACLTRTLEGKINAVALVHSADKLKKLLAAHNITESRISAHLTIIEGSVKDPSSVRHALVHPSSSPRTTDLIVSGLGGTPYLAWSVTQPVTLDDPHICEEGTRTILVGLSSSQADGVIGKPLFAVVSTTGLSEQRDVPLAFMPLYHWLLAVPHADKLEMERFLIEASDKTEGPIGGFVAVKPSLLMDGVGKRASGLRVGWGGGESEGEGPVVGYTAMRDDVGDWMFRELVSNEGRQKWAGRKVTLSA